MALANDCDFHLMAFLFRGKTLIRMGENSNKGHPKCRRIYKDRKVGFSQHAEMNVLRFARPNDTLIVVRFKKNGEATMAKPCPHCEEHIRKHNIRKVYYTDWNGNFVKLKL